MTTDAAGRLAGQVHVLPIRIYYEDTDLSGLVYHANYLRYMERGRSEFFRQAGIARARLEAAEPTAWALRKVALEFHRPARLDDLIEVHTRCLSLSGARLAAEQKIFRGTALLVHGSIEACLITLTGKPRRIPQEVRDKLVPFLYGTGA